MNAAELADLLLGSDEGQIAVLNLLAGQRVGQYSHEQLKDILWAWGDLAKKRNLAGSKIASALADLEEIFGSGRPALPHPPVLDDVHIIDRVDGGLAPGEMAASVKDAAAIHHWADTSPLLDDGVDLLAPLGTSTDARLEAKADQTWMIRTLVGKTVTYPAYPRRPVLFYTKGRDLDALLLSVPFAERADLARDKLGLSEKTNGSRLVSIAFQAEHVENRPDRGRPTAVDAGGYARFACEIAPLAGRSWGLTVDLAALTPTNIQPGLPERVCGHFPRDASSSVTVNIRVLGEVKLPRNDGPGVGDRDFAECLERMEHAADPGPSLRDKLLAIID